MTSSPTAIVRMHGASAVVMVQATPDAEQLASKSGLAVVDLLRPYHSMDASFNVSTVGEAYRLKGFSVRFVHTTEFKELSNAAIEAHLAKLLTNYDCAVCRHARGPPEPCLPFLLFSALAFC